MNHYLLHIFIRIFIQYSIVKKSIILIERGREKNLCQNYLKNVLTVAQHIRHSEIRYLDGLVIKASGEHTIPFRTRT
jgi:hypothetical protein